MEVAAISGHKTLQMRKRYTHLKATELVKKHRTISTERHAVTPSPACLVPLFCGMYERPAGSNTETELRLSTRSTRFAAVRKPHHRRFVGNSHEPYVAECPAVTDHLPLPYQSRLTTDRRSHAM